jgi:Mg2+-importing ATPase
MDYKGKIHEFDDDIREKCHEIYDKHNNDGLRVIAVAQKNNVPDSLNLSIDDESDMVLLGFIGFLDPPKESASLAINALKEHGVRIVILTGDSKGVTAKVCEKVGLEYTNILTGSDIHSLTDEGLKIAVEEHDVFTKLSPSQKQRIIKHLQENGHTVGYMGDGINDAPALKQADVGISVDSGVDIAKETANIILLEKDLMVLEQGVLEGRKTFGNIMKYIKMAASGNFGNMISLLIMSVFLPFLPLLPIHILTQNFLSDFSQIGMPFDSVDREYTNQPKKWNTKGVSRFMLVLGPVSSIFDISCFLVLFYIFKFNEMKYATLFQTGWFIFGILSQVAIVHMIRTNKFPFIQSRSSWALAISTVSISVIALVLAFTFMGSPFQFVELPILFLPWLLLLVGSYLLFTQGVKVIFIKLFKEWY